MSTARTREHLLWLNGSMAFENDTTSEAGMHNLKHSVRLKGACFCGPVGGARVQVGRRMVDVVQ